MLLNGPIILPGILMPMEDHGRVVSREAVVDLKCNFRRTESIFMSGSDVANNISMDNTFLYEKKPVVVAPYYRFAVLILSAPF